MAIRKRDLFVVPPVEVHPGVTLLKDQPVLHCDECGQDQSANPGDYWNVDEAHVFTCCDLPMRLGFWHRSFEECGGPEPEPYQVTEADANGDIGAAIGLPRPNVLRSDATGNIYREPRAVRPDCWTLAAAYCAAPDCPHAVELHLRPRALGDHDGTPRTQPAGKQRQRLQN